jgi:outer membrane protein assembly factor BamC
LIFGLVMAVCGCSLLLKTGVMKGRSEYLEAGSLTRTDIPSGLHSPQFDDLMAIPVVIDSRGLAGRKFELEIPEPLSTTYGIDRIVIKRLGDDRWIFLDASPATVWPRIEEFWSSQNLELSVSDPARGVMESAWTPSQLGDAPSIFESMVAGSQPAVLENKFRLRVIPGVRTSSTEVHLTHKIALLGDHETPRWDTGSDNRELEGEVLSRIARHLGESINESLSVSLVATGIQASRSELIPDPSEPRLTYNLSWDRAWATVNSALKTAEIDVEDLDRSNGRFYVYYDERVGRDPGFLLRLLMPKRAGGAEHRYTIQLKETEDENPVQVTVRKDEESLADPLFAERLLKIIKEFST